MAEKRKPKEKKKDYEPHETRRFVSSATENQLDCWMNAAIADGYNSRSQWIRDVCDQAASLLGYTPEDTLLNWGHGLLEYINDLYYNNQKEK